MSFRKNLNEQIYVKDWLKWKPYSSHTRYDKDFVAIANEVKNLLQNHPGGWFHSFDYRKEDYKNLALLLTSYFEDYISEIGIWKAYIDYNKRLFGKYLPFYDLEEYDPDDINHQDMAFLIWYFMCVNSGRFFGPDAPDILDISKDLFRLLEPKIEEVFVSEFYDSYFNIPDDIDFFELKNRLKWFALHSYLPGFEFSLRFAEDAAEYFEKNPEMGADPDMIGKMVYAFQEDYLYSKRSKLSAFSTLEWFSAVATCSEKMKQNILDLRKRVMSLFLYEGHDAQYYQFSQLQTKKLVSVHKESFTMNTRKTKEGESFFLTLVEWQGDWWLTGTLMGWGKPASDNLSDFDQDLGSIPFYLYSLEEQTGIIKNTDTMEANFLDYFHDQFILVKNQQELQKAMDKFLE
ncbi:MAG: DUF3843 family protein, partial [Saprospiraceae bacterium]|nr:DUF3843 family protein [Saprospiraceae bacterium]